MNLDLLAKPAVLATSVVAFVATALYVVVELPDEATTTHGTTIESQKTVQC